MGKTRKGTTARKQTKGAGGKNKIIIMAISLRNWACFTFSLDSSSDILMLVEISFD